MELKLLYGALILANSFKITGQFCPNTVYCTGSLTKLLTTYVSLSFLAEHHELKTILDDENFFDSISTPPAAKQFLNLFQNIIGSRFTLHDICSYYAGLPYTFDVSPEEIEQVEAGRPFKHHSILDENVFLTMCEKHITPVYAPRSKFHYSEISIIFLGYLLEKAYAVSMEKLYQKYLIGPFGLTNSLFSRKRLANCFTQDLSDRYDYPSIAIVDHGYFCYSNGFYTNLNDMKLLLSALLQKPVFHFMTDLNLARAASNRLMNGLSIELRLAKDDLVYGYEGLSFSGCNLWAYSNNNQQGYLTCHNSEEEIYQLIYDQLLGYTDFSAAPPHTQKIYQQFLKNYHDKIQKKDLPTEYQGNYQRVRMNEKILKEVFVLGKDFMVIRNPDEIKYDIIYVNGQYRVQGKDGVHGAKVGLCQAKSGNCYMYYDGTLYKKL